MKTKFFFAAILLSLTGYAFPSSDSSELATDLRNVNNFSGLIVNTTANVILSQGESNSIRIEGEKDMVKEITTTIENGALIIAGNNNHAITIYVTATDINLVEVNGNAKIYANGLVNSDILLLKVNGSGSIRMDVRTLTVGMLVKGSGKIIVSGSTGDSYSRVIGQGSIFADNLDARQIDRTASLPQVEKASLIAQ
ncbi:MAG TPA: DUF2807 domain-containing protein [Bacteroidia bacterium]|nr:DUF2807 domain-containing protein [Bacteroidota bacterium]MBK7430376.1 DUF2807 domain-containing protein [Bacteroidota bacterium]MBP9791194.1 DUF2807 domain-containing protein [Bacteroidia bacterium]HQW00097.1 DUF2807 domain-containing protein [Bacteroidia bacterium]HQW23963.1 DUF2807 domain-containing protein [Bacteroidia bacterium]